MGARGWEVEKTSRSEIGRKRWSAEPRTELAPPTGGGDANAPAVLSLLAEPGDVAPRDALLLALPRRDEAGHAVGQQKRADLRDPVAYFGGFSSPTRLEPIREAARGSVGRLARRPGEYP